VVNVLREDEVTSLFRLAKRLANQLEEALDADFVCIYARGRRIPQTHIFLVPTSTGDLLDGFLNALERFQVLPRELAALKDNARMAEAAAKIRRAGEP
jgi:histidine triad (HIT) family protein